MTIVGITTAVLLWSLLGQVASDAPPANPHAEPVGRRIDLTQFKLTWSDEFDGDTLDTSKWQAPEMERQGSSRWKASLVSVGDGVLRLGIRKTADPTFRYDCGAVRTQRDYDRNQTMFAQRYGYFETRCKLPRNLEGDYWAAFWMMVGRINDNQPDTRQGTEIDIMETFTFVKDAQYNLAFHWNGYGKKHNSTGLKTGSHPQVLDGEFHTFGLYWDEDVYVAFLDGVEVGRTDMMGLGEKAEGRTLSNGTARVPGYLKLSCEAAPWAGKTHLWESTMPESDEFVVDYVRVYEGTLPTP